MAKIVFSFILLFCGLTCFSQNAENNKANGVPEKDPKTIMWEKIRAESVAKDTAVKPVQNQTENTNDPKKEMWEKTRRETVKNTENPKPLTSEEIKAIEEKKRNQAKEKTN
ncbi:MAG: hypothetical protein A2W91_00580 [Bacteroidetes bacterium GWF2_38_335]|nr:MAG: hypothetical protein A2W91_00580 [Bacteroidetes bacterium GWF2_38_335]OFY78328.1 MAG: hypothetical protein A2281_03960 [Bacteroidetes bacterium RIFOXYA12_FULL_38_20]HBS87476.1 hypothetical protein [Bacteroidales bacterium]